MEANTRIGLNQGWTYVKPERKKLVLGFLCFLMVCFSPDMLSPFFPTCQVRVARFYQNFSFSSSSSFSFSSSPILFVSRQSYSSPSFSPILFASSGSQCGPHPPGSDRSVRRWISTARVRSQCAPLDLNRQTECQNICQNLCQIECKNICQIECQKKAM